MTPTVLASVQDISFTGWTIIVVNLLVVLTGLAGFAKWLRSKAGKALERVITGPVEELKAAMVDLKLAVDAANTEAARANNRIDRMLIHQAYPASELKGGPTNG